MTGAVAPIPVYVRRRSDYAETMDDFPTPPWAVRAFFKYVAHPLISGNVVCEPACGRGHIVRTVQEERPGCVIASDVKDYGYGYRVADFLRDRDLSYDYLITNPPFKLGEEFIQRGLREARKGVAILIRTLFLEGSGRHDRLFSRFPPTRVAIFSKRIPAAQGRVVQDASVFMSHMWLWWDKTQAVTDRELVWIPPDAQKRLESEYDYTDAFLRGRLCTTTPSCTKSRDAAQKPTSSLFRNAYRCIVGFIVILASLSGEAARGEIVKGLTKLDPVAAMEHINIFCAPPNIYSVGFSLHDPSHGLPAHIFERLHLQVCGRAWRQEFDIGPLSVGDGVKVYRFGQWVYYDRSGSPSFNFIGGCLTYDVKGSCRFKRLADFKYIPLREKQSISPKPNFRFFVERYELVGGNLLVDFNGVIERAVSEKKNNAAAGGSNEQQSRENPNSLGPSTNGGGPPNHLPLQFGFIGAILLIFSAALSCCGVWLLIFGYRGRDSVCGIIAAIGLLAMSVLAIYWSVIFFQRSASSATPTAATVAHLAPPGRHPGNIGQTSSSLTTSAPIATRAARKNGAENVPLASLLVILAFVSSLNPCFFILSASSSYV